MFLPKVIVGFVITALGLPFALAQKPPVNPGPTPDPRPPVMNAPRRDIPGTRTPDGTREPRKLFFLTGRVVFDDGTAPTESVNIDRVCDKHTYREGHTDSSGHFSIQLGQNVGVYEDASMDGGSLRNPAVATQGIPESQLMGCELRASYPGTMSDVLPLTGRQTMDNSDVGTIVLHRLGKIEGTKVSVTSLAAPKDAKKALEHAQKASLKFKWPEAQQDLEKAVTAYPAYAEAWSLLGITYKELHRPADAVHAFEKALEADSKFMEPYLQLAIIGAGDQDWPRVAELTDRALVLDAYEYPALYYFNALADWHLKKLDAAEKSARVARRLDSQYRIPTIDLILTMIFLHRQDYPAAAQQLREYLKHDPTGPEADKARAQLEEVERHLALAEKK